MGGAQKQLAVDDDGKHDFAWNPALAVTIMMVTAGHCGAADEALSQPVHVLNLNRVTGQGTEDQELQMMAPTGTLVPNTA